MATPTAFNLTANQKAERKLFALYVDVSSSATPEWELLGAGVEDSSVETNPDTKTITDIRGITETTVNKFEASQKMDPNTIRGGQKLNYKLLDIYRRGAVSELSQFTLLRVWGFIGTAGSYEAEKDVNCTIVPSSVGGSSYVDMPMDITFSGDRTLGTTNVIQQTSATAIVFTPTATV